MKRSLYGELEHRTFYIKTNTKAKEYRASLFRLLDQIMRKGNILSFVPRTNMIATDLSEEDILSLRSMDAFLYADNGKRVIYKDRIVEDD